MTRGGRAGIMAGVSQATTIGIRRARPADLPALGRLGAALLVVHHEFDWRRFIAPGADPEAGYAWFLGTQLESDDAAIFVAADDHGVMGTSIAASSRTRGRSFATRRVLSTT